MDKRIIIGISVSISLVVLVVCGWFGFKIHSNTKEAKQAATEFAALLQSGELETLSLKYYAYSEDESQVFQDENGQVVAQKVTRQQLAELFGAERIESKEEKSKEPLLKAIMKNSQVQALTGTVLGDTSEMDLQMMIPDIKSWLNNLGEEDVAYLNSLTANFLEDLESRMASGEIEKKYLNLRIPMLKQNGKWRFQVTEETEKAFFGGLYNLFDEETSGE